jgi:hypothetical protein
MFRFLPEEVNFFEFFDKHVVLIVSASEIFLETVSSDQIVINKELNPIKKIEHDADDIVHRCLNALHRTFITPIDRDDIYNLISTMDDVLDSINSAYNCILIYQIKESTPELKQLAKLVHESALKVETLVTLLKNLNPETASEICVEIHRLENEADDLTHKALAALFDNEKDAKNIIKWKEIYETLEDATDRCEDVADVVQEIILESV